MKTDADEPETGTGDPRRESDKPWWPMDEDALLVQFCALRFDGEKLDKELRRELPEHEAAFSYPALKHVYDTHYTRSLELLDDVKLNFGVFFLLQRAQKWHGTIDERDEFLYLKLFLHLHDVDVPAGYEYADCLREYKPRLRNARALAETLRPRLERAIAAFSAS
jgi:hypothetical protein